MKPLQDEKKIKADADFFERIAGVSKEYMRYWYHHTLLDWDFFLSWFLALVPWLLWMLFRRKTSTHRLLAAGFLALIFSSWLDFIGVELGLWYYTGLAVPTIPSYLPWDFCMIPVAIMFLIQIKPHISPYLKAAIFALGGSFVAEPLFQWIGFYVAVHWHHGWSAPFYFAIYLLCHYFCRAKGFDPLPGTGR